MWLLLYHIPACSSIPVTSLVAIFSSTSCWITPLYIPTDYVLLGFLQASTLQQEMFSEKRISCRPPPYRSEKAKTETCFVRPNFCLDKYVLDFYEKVGYLGLGCPLIREL